MKGRRTIKNKEFVKYKTTERDVTDTTPSVVVWGVIPWSSKTYKIRLAVTLLESSSFQWETRRGSEEGTSSSTLSTGRDMGDMDLSLTVSLRFFLDLLVRNGPSEVH